MYEYWNHSVSHYLHEIPTRVPVEKHGRGPNKARTHKHWVDGPKLYLLYHRPYVSRVPFNDFISYTIQVLTLNVPTSQLCPVRMKEYHVETGIDQSQRWRSSSWRMVLNVQRVKNVLPPVNSLDCIVFNHTCLCRCTFLWRAALIDYACECSLC